jgi:hypothetical protein
VLVISREHMPMQAEQNPGSNAQDGQASRQSMLRPGQPASSEAAAWPQPAQPGDKDQPAERQVFRMGGAIVAWWAWVVIAVACLTDLALSGRDHTSAEIAVAVAVITGVMYACAVRPMVIADPDGITVRNPLRDHRVPWGLVTAVDLRESVQVHCAKEPGARREKVIHSWALYAQRRSRIRAELKEQRSRARLPQNELSPHDRVAAEAQRLARQPMAQIMADQLDELARKGRERGAAAGPRTVTWAWQPAVAIVVPVIALVLVITAVR